MAHGIGKRLVAPNGGMRVVSAIHRDAAPVDEAAAPTDRAVEQVGVVEHERVAFGDAAFAGVQPDGDPLVHDPRPAHLQRMRQVRAVVHLIPFAGKQWRGHEHGKQKRNAYHSDAAIVRGERIGASACFGFKKKIVRGGTRPSHGLVVKQKLRRI